MTLFLTWSTYGTWLQGDGRGWYSREEGFMEPDLPLLFLSRDQLKDDPVYLTSAQRELVESIIRKHCNHAGWDCIILNCRTNHVHVLVTVGNDLDFKIARKQLKKWTTHHLKKKYDPDRSDWWTEGGWDILVDEDPESMAGIIEYIRNQ